MDGHEKQPEVFEVGRVVRDWQYRLRIVGEVSPNLATPHIIGRVLDEVDALTKEIEAKDAARRSALFVEFCDALCLDVMRWRVRLDHYRARLAEASSEDRESILWSVTAPLFLGQHGGRTGVEVALPEGGFPEGFNPTAQHVADIATPYSLANQMAVAQEWEERRVALLDDDMWNETKRIVNGAADAAGVSYPWLVAGAAVATATAVGVVAFRWGRTTRGAGL